MFDWCFTTFSGIFYLFDSGQNYGCRKPDSHREKPTAIPNLLTVPVKNNIIICILRDRLFKCSIGDLVSAFSCLLNAVSLCSFLYYVYPYPSYFPFLPHESLPNIVALSSIPARAGFLRGRKWKGFSANCEPS